MLLQHFLNKIHEKCLRNPYIYQKNLLIVNVFKLNICFSCINLYIQMIKMINFKCCKGSSVGVHIHVCQEMTYMRYGTEVEFILQKYFVANVSPVKP